jgi:formamidopyrimidine-DNA glycosylase
VPELPEVEEYARTFARRALGRNIVRVRVLDERILAVRKSAFVRALTGRQFTRVRRHGKHLFAHVGRVLNPSGRPLGRPAAAGRVETPSHIGEVWLRLHFGMTGDLTTEVDRFARVVFEFDDGTLLAYDDMRLFGVVDLVRDPDVFIRERNLGPDPLMIGLREFRARVARRRGAIKALLLSQEVIAGVGNLYADETLFRAGIHPRRAADRLSDDEVKSLFAHLRRVLREAIAGRRVFLVEREEGERCPRCGGTIQRAIVGGRTTYFCARHQRAEP